METRFPTESPPDLDFGASWARFWEVLGSIFEAFSDNFAEHWGAFAIQDRFENLPSASLQKERRFPFHVKSGLCWRAFFHLFDSKTPLDAPRRPKTPPRRPQDGPRRLQEAPRRPQGSENGGKMEPSWHQNGVQHRLGSKSGKPKNNLAR